MYPLALVRQLLLHFADLAGYEGHLLVTFDKAKFDRACARYRLTPADDEDYGETIVNATRALPLTWINLSLNTTIARLTRTCAHEALHIARPEMPHGPAYDRAVGRMLRSCEP